MTTGPGSSLKLLGVVLSAVLLHLYRLTSLPEKPPPIDWVYYKTAVAKAGMVDEFEKKVRFSSSIRCCSCFEIQVEAAHILEKFRTMIPFDQMMWEDLNEIFPETRLDKKYPYWPHKPIENL
ncbi:ATP synthase subunit d, mitochondrial-like [Trachemys scripta elegans]|uniref:ATP synthase subunit d, mitochondrial-like n=1 Tax=Trachemys scripta elegans TaxID=31138 RepID=UPI001555B3AF|nr:ATP synthase subunit d, mitochondrial-like [Trachemys scripta elegans]